MLVERGRAVVGDVRRHATKYEYVSKEGIHTNQVECFWSLLEPWLAKFRGLSKQGLEQAAHTFGSVRSLNLVRAPIHSLIDCVAVNAFH